jgi:hypothetical protein
LGSNRLKCTATGHIWAPGPNLLKVGRLAPGVLKCGAAPTARPPRTDGRLRKKFFASIHAASKVAKVARCRGRTKVAKVGPSPGEAGSNLLKPDRRRRLTKKGLRSTKKGLRSAGGPKLLKCSTTPFTPGDARVKSAKVRPTRHVYSTPGCSHLTRGDRERRPGGPVPGELGS